MAARSDPFIVCWPAGITARGEIRTQYAHIIDMVPTVLDALGIEPPSAIAGVTQSPIEGVSFRHTFDDAAAATPHITQYFEMLGHRSIYHDGWRAVCPWPGTSFTESGHKFGDVITADMLNELDANGWELYHVADDIAETTNLAAEERARLIAMIAMWYTEAGRYNVLPIDSRGTARIAEERPQIAVSRDRYVLYPGTQSIPAAAAPKILNRPYSHHRGSRHRPTATKGCCSAWAAMTAASPSTFKAGCSASLTTMSPETSITSSRRRRYRSVAIS